MLSGNRNFEGRVNADVRANYLASPPLVVAYAIAGSMNVDMAKEPLGVDQKGKKVFLKDIWPSNKEIGEFVAKNVTKQIFAKKYADVFKGDANWRKIAVKGGTDLRLGRPLDLRAEPAVFRRHGEAPASRSRTSSTRACWRCCSTRSPPTTSRRRDRSRRNPAGEYLRDHQVRRRTSTSTARAAAIIRS